MATRRQGKAQRSQIVLDRLIEEDMSPLKDLIRKNFSATPRPFFRKRDLPPDAHFLFDRGTGLARPWDTLPAVELTADQSLLYEPDSPAAQYYLPAYLLAAMHDPSLTQMIHRAILAFLEPPSDLTPLGASMRSFVARNALWNDDQLRTLGAVVAFYAKYSSGLFSRQAERALAAYWNAHFIQAD
jgi:hypothetical protein